MTHKLPFILVGFIVAVLFILSVVVLISGQEPVHANPFTATRIGAATTSATVQLTAATSARVLATTTGVDSSGVSYTRVYATICNQSATPVELLMNNDKAVSISSGATAIIGLAAGLLPCYEITDRNMYTGSVTASSSGSVSVYVSDYVQ